MRRPALRHRAEAEPPTAKRDTPIRHQADLALIASACYEKSGLGLFQVRRMEELRENGNIGAAHLLAYTRDKLDEFKKNRNKMQKLKDEVRKRIHTLEQHNTGIL